MSVAEAAGSVAFRSRSPDTGRGGTREWKALIPPVFLHLLRGRVGLSHARVSAFVSNVVNRPWGRQDSKGTLDES